MAAQPSRPPPDNLLFRGPPPVLPRVLLLPADTLTCDTVFPPGALSNALQQMNNVGVPCEDLFDSQANNHTFENNPCADPHLSSLLRRTHSFDISYVYHGQCDENVESAHRLARSEPDLSKIGYFVEAEVALDCVPMQPPPLVLNNPFYDGSFALDPSLLNQSMVVLPDNYLAFEDSFVPTWDYKPEFLNNTELNPELYYETLPIIPSNDPWSVYDHDNSNYNYYSPQLEVPTDDGIQYMRFSDLEFALPQYMNLPAEPPIESLKNETNEHGHINAERDMESRQNAKENNISEKHLCDKVTKESKETPPPADTVVIAPATEDNNCNNIDSNANRESSCSEDSLNADISNDVTSSLAFVPSSKSSQVAHAGDDTSDDTSPCSTDYQEASALDLAQSLSSCGDSTDFSQSRDDVSPIPEAQNDTTPCVAKNEANLLNGPHVQALEKTLVKVPLSQLPSIPDYCPLSKIPPVPTSLPDVNSFRVNSKKTQTQKSLAVAEPVVNKNDKPPTAPSDSTQASSVSVRNVIAGASNVSQKHPVPPCVPAAWLAAAPLVDRANVQKNVPQICIQNAEGQAKAADRGPRTGQQAAANASEAGAPEPQPSCSFAPPPPPHNTQLKPDKQHKEVECVHAAAYASTVASPACSRSAASRPLLRARTAASAMAELALKPDRVREPLRFSSFYELYKRFLKDHGCKWHDVAKLLNVVAEVLFDVDGAFTRIAGKMISDPRRRVLNREAAANATKCARGGTSECAGGRSHGLPIFLVHDHYLAPTAALACATDLSKIPSALRYAPGSEYAQYNIRRQTVRLRHNSTAGPMKTCNTHCVLNYDGGKMLCDVYTPVKVIRCCN
ncbi:hypothetical protein RR48_10531 [Papilio machaon]|uniref:Uncharacterized protein n=1 Tax=Papilio machaon TaxID=76193 RepID=A0A194RAL3_PAPMA|nr:hypothetical protein RR48_10531 [Papilio machaon]